MVRRNPGLGGLYQQARYPLVVLADEVLLSSRWPHARDWESELLEQKHFGTNVAGDRFFQLLERAEELPSDVAGVYYRALLLAFRSHFTPGDPKLGELQARLLKRIDPDDELAGELLSPASHETVLEGTARLPRLWRWRFTALIAVGLIVVLVLVERFLVWPWLTSPVADAADRAESLMRERSQAAQFGSALAADGGTSPVAAPADASVDRPTGEAGVRFVVEAGRFKGEDGAQKFFAQLVAEGLQPELYSIEGEAEPTFAVMLGVFDEAPQAEARRVEIAGSHHVSAVVRELAPQSLSCVSGCE
jgi:type IV/VI secretion system ImpK/VasF family protein